MGERPLNTIHLRHADACQLLGFTQMLRRRGVLRRQARISLRGGGRRVVIGSAHSMKGGGLGRTTRGEQRRDGKGRGPTNALDAEHDCSPFGGAHENFVAPLRS